MTTEVVNTTTNTTTTTLLRRTSRTSYRDNASDILPLRVSVTDEDWKDQMIAVAKALCPFLKSNNTMTVTPLSGGLSNELFIVRSADETKSVLVRIHPSSSKNMPSIVDRHVENAISAWLSSQKVGPTYYGRFQNGRVEEFYPHHAPLSWKDMPRVGPSHIAPIMANFHALQVPATVLQPTNLCDGGGDIFARVREWMEIAVQLDGQRTNEKASHLLKQLQQDWTWLENVLLKQQQQPPCGSNDDDNLLPQTAAAMNFFSEIVFCHMDMQSLNLLRDTTQTDKDVIKVIDFEYAGFNPRGVDMANTFCEHCDMNNIRADYAKEYPSDDIQSAFIKRYLQQLSASEDLLQLADDPVFLEAARFVIGRYALLSHMSWAIWSIVQSHMSDIDFDYIHYAQHRRDGFEFMKQKLGL